MVLQKPGAWLAAVDAHLPQMPHPFALLAIVVLSREAPDRAAYYADRLDPVLTPDERALIWGRIGRSGLLEMEPAAHDWFERGGDGVGQGVDYVRGPEVLEARARAALRRGANGVPAAPFGAALRPPPAAPDAPAPGPVAVAGSPAAGPDWPAVRRAIGHMTAEQQAETGWIYWNAHALIATGRAEEGRAALKSIAERFSFYGRLAAEELDLPFALPAPPPPADPALVEQLAQRPAFRRARHLYDLGLHDEGNREWSWEMRGMDDATLHASAELAQRLGVLDRMIASAERNRGIVDIAQRYPLPYREIMEATAVPLGLDPAWIYGLIRQESRFMEDIRSNAGAVGLMQIMPSTARFVAHRIGFDHYRADRIGEVGVNLRLGTEYLKLVSDDQDGRALLASAAYNAGPRRVRRWRAALAAAAGRRDLRRNDSDQRDPRLRQEGAVQHGRLRRHAGSPAGRPARLHALLAPSRSGHRSFPTGATPWRRRGHALADVPARSILLLPVERLHDLCLVRPPEVRSRLAAVEGRPRVLGDRPARVLPGRAGQPPGLRRCSRGFQLKIIQEIVTLAVFIGFAVFFLREKLAWNYLVAFSFLGVAAFFAFAFTAPR